MHLGLFFILTSVFAYKNEHSSESESKSSSEDEDYRLEKNTDEVGQLDLRGTFRKSFAIQMALINPDKNSVCSPISALLPLGNLALGAEKKGQRELLDTIGVNEYEMANKFKSLVEELNHLQGVSLNVVSKIYVSKEHKLNNKFAEESRSIFQSDLQKVDFNTPVETAGRINRWINRHTKGMIPEIITSEGISSNSSLILVNAVYFDGEWDHPFHTAKLQPFYSPRNKKDVPMMSRIGSYNYVKSKNLRSKIIQIPYKKNEASLVILLPVAKKGLTGLLNELKRDPGLLNEALSQMKKIPISLKIPKFTINTEINLKDLYEKVNVNKIFDEKSDLTKIVDAETVSVSKAIQRTIVEVTEHGTKAAAAASAVITPVSLPQYKTKFHANRPFLFFVIANRQQLFAGIFNNKNN